MTSLVVLFYLIISRKVRQLQKFHQRSYTVILTDLFNAMKKLWEKISFHKHFKPETPVVDASCGFYRLDANLSSTSSGIKCENQT